MRSVAAQLGTTYAVVRQWTGTYRAVGVGGLESMGGRHRSYSYETKVAAARAVAEEGATRAEAMERFGIASASPLRDWVRAYREGGPEALRPKPRGRPRGARAARGELTREEELERRIRKLEAENAYLKKSIALRAEGRSRTARRRPS